VLVPEVSEDIHAEALERYERARAFIWRGLMPRAELEQGVLGYGAVPVTWPDAPQWTPFRDRIPRVPRLEQQRLAEQQDRRGWLEGVRRRLGLVAEVHRCRVWKHGEWWRWWCLRPACPCGGFARRGPGAFTQAVTEALEHARRFVPGPPEETMFAELDLLAFEAAWDAVRDQRERMAAALPARAQAIADQLSEGLPEGLRFEWRADGE